MYAGIELKYYDYEGRL